MIALRALNDNTTHKFLTAEARNPVVLRYTDTNIVRICNCLFLVTWIGDSAGDTVLLYLHTTNQDSVDVSCLSLFPTIFKISGEHILNKFFSFVFSIENP